MKKIELEFSFKGNRNYVHATDIYKQLIKNLTILGFDHWQYFELNIKKITSHNLTCFISDNRQKNESEIISFIFEQDQIKLFGSIIENTNKNIESRYSFNEHDITQYCIIDYEQETITYCNSMNTFKSIDILISMSRFFLENAVDNSVKWFCRTVKLFRPIEEIESQQILVKKVVQKRNIVVLDVYIENQVIGSINGASISDY
jgi:hypothetical protein